MLDLSTHFKSELTQVDEALLAMSLNKHELIISISKYIVSTGGKRLRAILTILSAKIFCDYPGFASNNHIGLAAAVEAIHTATLLHDDVVDNSSVRRNKPTANYIWDNQATILVGDFLFSQAFCLMVKHGDIRILEILSNAASIIAEGEVMQLSVIGDYELTYAKYLEIIGAKTAQLFAASCQVGSLSSGVAIEIADIFFDIGFNFGLAFQLSDDVLDYSNLQVLGKNTGDDFFEGKVTFPIILLLAQTKDEEKSRVIRLFSQDNRTKEDLSYVQDLLKTYNILQQIKKYIDEYIEKIEHNLNKIPQNENINILRSIIYLPIERLKSE